MKNFENVSIVKKANIYFNGAVASRTVNFPDGTTKTLGFMQLGEYEFNTEKAELMEIQTGNCCVQLQGENKWNEYAAGESFEVPKNSKFKIKILTATDYICSFID